MASMSFQAAASAQAYCQSHVPDRSHYKPIDTIKHIWSGLNLPKSALTSVGLERGEGESTLPSSFKVTHLAQASITLSALAAALVDSVHNLTPVPQVTVEAEHASVEFASDRLFSLNGAPNPSEWGPLGGLHKTSDGYVRIHDNALHHRLAALSILGLPKDSTREEVSARVLHWKAIELESAALANKAVIFALRSYEEWDATVQARSVPHFPVSVRKIADAAGRAGFPAHMPSNADRCLRGLRVLDLTKVIAGPVAGKTLAAHGADVLWVTDPKAEERAMDVDVQRGKRTIQLDLTEAKDKEILLELAKEADVFLQSYRPGSLAAKGLSVEALSNANPGIICANMAAWGTEGPWKENRGFDSMVQNASGLNVAEAGHFDPSGSTVSKPLPVQALDHAGGYLLATGIATAVYKRAVEGGSWRVDVTLAGVGRYLRSLGQLEGKTGFDGRAKLPKEMLREEMLEERTCTFGVLKAVRHTAKVEGKTPGWDIMPKRLGSDEAKWL